MDKEKFFSEVRTHLFGGKMKQSQVKGINAILDAWDKLAPKSDPRWIAYSLATTFHETDRTMQPIEEYGKGKGKVYGAPKGVHKQCYYGRGLVQLTWEYNYVYAMRRLRALGMLRPSEDLARTPELALRPDIAAAILVLGMEEGWFTHKKLQDFFRGTRSDWVDARKIINGRDRAQLVASYGLGFYHALTEGAAP